jgi:hypothetical protein
MDIYNFINSKDIAEHCRNINHQFNALEGSLYRLLMQSPYACGKAQGME